MDKIIEKQAWYKKKKIWIYTGIGLFVFIFFVTMLSDTSSKLRIEKDKLTIETVKKDKFQDYMATIGTVHPIRTIYLDAMVGGRVEEIVREEGAMVDSGDIILKLSNPNLNLSILNTEAELAEKTNFLRNTRVELERDRLNLKQKILDITYKLKKLERDYKNKKQFFAQGLVSEEEYKIAEEEFDYARETKKLLKERQKNDEKYRKIQIDQLEGSLKQMRKNIDLVRKKMENLEVKAPISGQLGSLNAEIGEQKKQGERLGLINNLSSYKVRAEIDEHFISRVRTGLTAVFAFNGQNYTLKISKVYPEVRSGRFEIDMIFTSDMPENIRTGQTFRVKLQLGEAKEALLLPKGGFYQSTGGQWVFVVAPSGEFATRRKIRIGRHNPQYYEVLEGLKPGEKVITSSYDNYIEIDKIIFK